MITVTIPGSRLSKGEASGVHSSFFDEPEWGNLLCGTSAAADLAPCLPLVNSSDFIQCILMFLKSI